jgi:hypothetical protein
MLLVACGNLQKLYVSYRGYATRADDYTLHSCVYEEEEITSHTTEELLCTPTVHQHACTHHGNLSGSAQQGSQPLALVRGRRPHAPQEQPALQPGKQAGRSTGISQAETNTTGH